MLSYFPQNLTFVQQQGGMFRQNGPLFRQPGTLFRQNGCIFRQNDAEIVAYFVKMEGICCQKVSRL